MNIKKFFILPAMVLLITAIISIAYASEIAEINKPAPNFKLKDSKGKEHSLSDYKGKYVVIEWVNYDCPFVKKHYESNNMQELQKKYTEKGVVWLSICSSAPGKQGNFTSDEINKRAEQLKAAHTAYLIDEDGAVGKIYGAKTTPHKFIVDKNGILVYAGAIDDNPSPNKEDAKTAKNWISTNLDLLMSGKPCEESMTKSYGCSVKYAN